MEARHMERIRLPRFLIAVLSGCALAVAGLGGVATAAPPDLEDTVAQELIAAKSDEARDSYGVRGTTPLSTLVETKRTSDDGRWAFGGAVIKVPDSSHASPITALFFGQRTGAGWQVSLKGTEAFAAAAQDAPAELLRDEGEREVLAATATRAKGPPTGLALPWANGQGGWRHWGVHGNSGDSRPYNS